MDKSSTTTTITYPSFSESCWSKQAICSSSNAANDHPEYAISARDKSLHSEFDKSNGVDGYSDEPSSVPKF